MNDFTLEKYFSYFEQSLIDHIECEYEGDCSCWGQDYFHYEAIEALEEDGQITNAERIALRIMKQYSNYLLIVFLDKYNAMLDQHFEGLQK